MNNSMVSSFYQGGAIPIKTQSKIQLSLIKKVDLPRRKRQSNSFKSNISIFNRSNIDTTKIESNQEQTSIYGGASFSRMQKTTSNDFFKSRVP